MKYSLGDKVHVIFQPKKKKFCRKIRLELSSIDFVC